TARSPGGATPRRRPRSRSKGRNYFAARDRRQGLEDGHVDGPADAPDRTVAQDEIDRVGMEAAEAALAPAVAAVRVLRRTVVVAGQQDVRGRSPVHSLGRPAAAPLPV